MSKFFTRSGCRKSYICLRLLLELNVEAVIFVYIYYQKQMQKQFYLSTFTTTSRCRNSYICLHLLLEQDVEKVIFVYIYYQKQMQKQLYLSTFSSCGNYYWLGGDASKSGQTRHVTNSTLESCSSFGPTNPCFPQTFYNQ